MVVESPEVRAAALAWLSGITLDGELEVSRSQLANDFVWEGERFPLIDRGRGIRKPEAWTSALSITTSELRRDTGGSAQNEGLRTAMRRQEALMWFYGVAPSQFRATWSPKRVDGSISQSSPARSCSRTK